MDFHFIVVHLQSATCQNKSCWSRYKCLQVIILHLFNIRYTYPQGAINRHKEQTSSNNTNSDPSISTLPPATYRGRGAPSRRPYIRTIPSPFLSLASRGHPYARGRSSAPVSRHRTLIVNPRPEDSPTPETSTTTSTTNGQWIQKRDRHMQLINAAVYEERTQARQNEILESKKQKILDRQAKRDKVERTRLYTFLKKRGQGNQISISGSLYRVTAQGNKLEKFQGTADIANGRE